MARQRMVKPEFFDSESLGECSVWARLAFIGLWVNADDYGRQKLQVKRLRTRIFPYDEISDEEFAELLLELEAVGCIKAYEVDGEDYIYVPNFELYQTVNHPSKSLIPKPEKKVEKLLKNCSFRDCYGSAHVGLTLNNKLIKEASGRPLLQGAPDANLVDSSVAESAVEKTASAPLWMAAR